MVEIETDLGMASLKRFFAGILQDWPEDPQKWLQISRVWSEILSDGGRGGLQISSEALGTDLANLVLKVVLRIYRYVVQN
jgi:hypothetical protein